MKELRYTSQFKKDLKRFLNQPKKLKALEWYKKSKGERDSEERIAKLSSR